LDADNTYPEYYHRYHSALILITVALSSRTLWATLITRSQEEYSGTRERNIQSRAARLVRMTIFALCISERKEMRRGMKKYIRQ